MAWQASGAWKSSLDQTKKDDSSFPGLKPTSPEATTKIEYEELQNSELYALEAIYGDDFVMHTGTHSAWKVCIHLVIPLQADCLENGTDLRHSDQSPE